MLVPLVLMSSINYRLTYRHLYNNLVNATQDDTGNIAYYLTMEFSEYFNLSYYVTYNSELKNKMEGYYAGDISLESLSEQVLSVVSSPGTFKRVRYPFEYFVVLEDGSIITRYNHSGVINYQKAYSEISETEWHQSLSRDSAEAVRVFQDGDYINDNGGDKIYIARNIVLDNNQNAVFAVGISRYLIDRLIDNYRPVSGSSIFVYADGKCVARGEQNRVTEEEAQKLYEYVIHTEKPVGTEYIKETEEDTLFNLKSFYFSDIPSEEWHVAVITPTKDILQSIQYIKNTTVILIILCIAGAVTLFYLAKKSIFDRIIVLKDGMVQVAEGSTSVYLEPNQDEIGKLYEGFNDMTRSLGAAKERADREEKERIALELTMLQAQITPHFIRNTLNSIRWMAEMLKEDGIARSLVSLTKLLDYHIREFTEGVTISDELNNLQEYIYIEKLRHGNTFTYETEIEPELMTQKTLKLLLQPIVENCLIHGFKSLDKVGIIKIRGKLEGEQILIYVEDNGNGMTEADRENCLSPRGSSKSSRIGIYNVNQRIRHHYGERYGLTVEQNEPQGTRVKVTLPYR